MREENNSMLYDFVDGNQFELDSYLTYLFDQIDNYSEILSED
jgi:hypothetical protein